MEGLTVTREEVAARAAKGRLTFVINNTVYDVTTFADDHPGGREVFASNAGGDATQCWFDVGHSEEAQALMLSYAEGSVPAEQRRAELRRVTATAGSAAPPLTLATFLSAAGPPLVLGIVATFIYFYLFS